MIVLFQCYYLLKITTFNRVALLKCPALHNSELKFFYADLQDSDNLGNFVLPLMFLTPKQMLEMLLVCLSSTNRRLKVP